MNTSIIKKERTEQNIQPAIKISRNITGISSNRKSDLVSMLRDENNSLYNEYLEVIKRNVELRAIVEKQQKLINAIYNAELNIILPDKEKTLPEIELPVATLRDPESIAPVTEFPAIETLQPEVKLTQPLGTNDLAYRICRLRRKKWQSQKSLIEKTKFLLSIYNAPNGIQNVDLFAACGISRMTGNRYVSFFRKFSMVSHGGNYSITNQGKKFVEGEPSPEWDKHLIKKWRIIH